MPIHTAKPMSPAIAADGTTPFTPEQILEQLRALRDHVPDFGPLPVADSSSLHMAARAPALLVRRRRPTERLDRADRTSATEPVGLILI